MGITTGVVKIGPDGSTHIGKIEKAHIPWNQSVYTKITVATVPNFGYVKIPYESGYSLYDEYYPAILGGMNSGVYTSNSYVGPVFIQDVDLTWGDVSNPLYDAGGVVPGNLVKVLNTEGQVYQTQGLDGYMHEVVGVIGYRESTDSLTKEHVIFFGYRSLAGLWLEIQLSDIYAPQIGDAVMLYVPTSIDPENYRWATNINNDTPKQIITQEYKLEYVAALTAQTTGASAFATFDLRYLPSLGAALRGYLNGIEVNVQIVNKARATSFTDIIIDTRSATYPICDVYWNGSSLTLSGLGDLVLADIVRLYCTGKAKNSIGLNPFSLV